MGRRTRSKYHQAAKKAKNNIEIYKNTKAANAFLEKGSQDFWSEIHKLRGKTNLSPSMIDNRHDEKDISGEFTCQYKHTIDLNDVAQAVTHIKLGKSDGYVGHSSDHIKYASAKLFILMFMYRNAPHNMLISTIVPIPKNRKKSINDSDNYRGIALSSVLGKDLDSVILKGYEKALKASDMQFSFKEKHSTTQCKKRFNMNR